MSISGDSVVRPEEPIKLEKIDEEVLLTVVVKLHQHLENLEEQKSQVIDLIEDIKGRIGMQCGKSLGMK